jgi:hypothetical protein
MRAIIAACFGVFNLYNWVIEANGLGSFVLLYCLGV